MNYKGLGRTQFQVSEVGLGCEHLEGQDEVSIRAVVDQAIEAGINIFDVFMSEPNVRTHLGRALAGRRDQVILQGHIGSVWLDGQYARSRDIRINRHFFTDFLERLQTDYVDIGMIHFIDSAEDFQKVFQSEIIRYAQQLKQDGVIRAIGLSSHNPVIAKKAVETGLIDVLMFSINPAYDAMPADMDLDTLFSSGAAEARIWEINPARAALYQACELNDVGVTVMKGLAAGTLLHAERSPFGVAMTPEQCIHYALTRPAVASMLVGCRTPAEVSQAVRYEQATEQERDYSMILGQNLRHSMVGRCMYCNHCLPCPVYLDIAQVNKYLDMVPAAVPVAEAALAGAGITGLAGLVSPQSVVIPASVKAHYQALEHTAADCIACGVCETRCPFGVKVVERMQQAVQVFGC